MATSLGAGAVARKRGKRSLEQMNLSNSINSAPVALPAPSSTLSSSNSLVSSNVATTLKVVLAGATVFTQTLSANIGCGFLSGFIVTGLLNPWDRALYLSLTHKRHFLDFKNFHNPYQGVTQTLIQRSLSTGLYFPLEELFLNLNVNYVNKISNVTGVSLSVPIATMLAGNLAGIVNGFVLSPLSFVKYQIWSRSSRRKDGGTNCKITFIQQARYLYQHAGAKVFLRGARATCARDAVFGAVYSFLRHKEFDFSALFYKVHIARTSSPVKMFQEVKDEKVRFEISQKYASESRMLKELCAAGIATIMSSPLNYVRNIQFHAAVIQRSRSYTSGGTRVVKERVFRLPSMKVVLVRLGEEVRGTVDRQGVAEGVKVLQHRLRIGWGTLRVAVGMALASKFYSLCHSNDRQVKRFEFSRHASDDNVD